MQHPGWVLIVVGVLIALIGLVWLRKMLNDESLPNFSTAWTTSGMAVGSRLKESAK
jgi:hypothetical protein